jgi:hypothetical protein
VGFLAFEGIIRGVEEIRSLTVEGLFEYADVRLTTDFAPPRRRVVTSGCGGGITFSFEARKSAARPEPATVEPGSLFSLRHEPLHRSGETARAHTDRISAGRYVLCLQSSGAGRGGGGAAPPRSAAAGVRQRQFARGSRRRRADGPTGSVRRSRRSTRWSRESARDAFPTASGRRGTIILPAGPAWVGEPPQDLRLPGEPGARQQPGDPSPRGHHLTFCLPPRRTASATCGGMPQRWDLS